MPVRKKDFFQIMGIIIIGFGFGSLALIYGAPEKWYNDAIRVGFALTMLIFAVTALLAHHITLEIDRLSQESAGERT